MKDVEIETLGTVEHEGAWHGPGSFLTVTGEEWDRLKADGKAKRAKRRQSQEPPPES